MRVKQPDYPEFRVNKKYALPKSNPNKKKKSRPLKAQWQIRQGESSQEAIDEFFAKHIEKTPE